MKISSDVLTGLIDAIESVGEDRILDIFNNISNCQPMIDEIADIVCNSVDLNKQLLFIKGIRDIKKKKSVTAIIYVLRKNGVKPEEIIKYFKGQELRINEMFMSISYLSDKIPYDRELKELIESVSITATEIFNKYHYFNPPKD